MKKSLKTLAMWLIMGIILIVLISSIMDNSQNKMTYSELMIAIETGKVENIEISADGTKGYVTLKDNKKIFIGILIGMLISSGSVYAASIISKDVPKF